MLLCEGIRPLSRTLVEVGSSTGVERWSGWFYWLSFGRYGLLSCCQTPSSYLSQHCLTSFTLGLSVFELKLPC